MVEDLSPLWIWGMALGKTGRLCRLEVHHLKRGRVSYWLTDRLAHLLMHSRTDEQKKPISWCLGLWWSFNTEEAHSRHDGADEVDVEDGQDVY